MLKVTALHFDYHDKPLLQDIHFTVSPGGLLHVHGRNGSGKTTLLKLLAGLYTPTTGTVYYDGQTIEHQHAHYQQQLCYVGHKPGINPHLSVQENCFFDVHFHDDEQKEQPKERLRRLLRLFQLERYFNTPCALLSSGQQRQVALLRLWFAQVNLWLLDEPFVALDEQATNTLMDHIKQHREQGGMVVLTSHQPLALQRSEYQDYRL